MLGRRYADFDVLMQWIHVLRAHHWPGPTFTARDLYPVEGRNVQTAGALMRDDWDDFLTHLKELGIRHTRVITRPENNSQFCYIHDPDHTMIELVYHGNRPPLGGGKPSTEPRS